MFILFERRVLVSTFVIFIFCFNQLCSAENDARVGATPISPPTCDDKTDHEEKCSIDDIQPELRVVELPKSFKTITRADLDDYVIESSEVWVIIAHNATIPITWLNMMLNLEGIVWFGISSVPHFEDILQLFALDVDQLPSLIVLPYGTNTKGKKQWTVYSDVDEAINAAIQSLPNRWISFEDNLIEILMDCYMSAPSKFPAYLVTASNEVPTEFLSLALRFSKYFTFIHVVNPTDKELRSTGLHTAVTSTPAFVVMMAEGQNDKGSPRMTAVPYDKDVLGQMDYPHLMYFLFAVNSKYRKTLPGNSMNDDPDIVNMRDVYDVENLRFKGSNKEDMDLKRELMQYKTFLKTINSKDEL